MTITALAVCSVLPLGWLGWARWFSEQAYVVLAPIAHPITTAVDFIVPPRRAESAGGQRERTLEDELARARVRLLQAEQRAVELETLVEQLSRGAMLNPDVRVTQIPRPKLAEVGEMLLVRAGSRDGVHRGAVITARAVQVVGRVAEAFEQTCHVLPITARSAPGVSGVVILDENTGRRAPCLLRPVGDGTLVGEVSPPEDGRAEEVRVGQTVRLLDEQWPRHAQMLVIGDVERVEPSPDQPLRRRITVRPRANLRRVSDVVVRLPGSGVRTPPESSGAEGGGG